MAEQTNIATLSWDLTIPEALTETQEWVLTTMRKHGPALVTMLWRILGNEQDVCDAYQNTFLKLAHYNSGQKPRYIKAYVFRTASNTAMSMLRRKITERNKIQEIAPTEYESPDELNSNLLRDNLRKCIARLPENLRQVVALHDLAEMPYQQVSKIMGITTATARVYRCKAVQLLAVWMNKSEGYK